MCANAVSTSAGVLLGLLGHGRVTFRDATLTPRRALRFLLVNAVALWLAQPLAIGVLTRAGVGVVPAKLLAVGVGVVLTWTAYRTWVWGEAAGRAADVRPSVPRP